MTGTGTVPHLVAALKHSDAKLKRQAANSLAQIVKHNVDLAEVAVEAGMFPTCVSLCRLGVVVRLCSVLVFS